MDTELWLAMTALVRQKPFQLASIRSAWHNSIEFSGRRQFLSATVKQLQMRLDRIRENMTNAPIETIEMASQCQLLGHK